MPAWRDGLTAGPDIAWDPKRTAEERKPPLSIRCHRGGHGAPPPPPSRHHGTSSYRQPQGPQSPPGRRLALLCPPALMRDRPGSRRSGGDRPRKMRVQLEPAQSWDANEGHGSTKMSGRCSVPTSDPLHERTLQLPVPNAPLERLRLSVIIGDPLFAHGTHTKPMYPHYYCPPQAFLAA